MANVAAAVGAVFSDTFLRPGDDEVEIAERYAQAASALTPTVGPVLAHVFGVQQRNQIRQAAMDGTARSRGRGPGRRGAHLLLRRPGGVHQPRRERAAGRAGRGRAAPGGAGDRSGRAAGEAGQDDRRRRDAELARHRRAARRGAALVDAVDAERRTCPQLKAGIARGEALGRAGDWYGRPVNLASRVTGVARPGSVLTEEAAHEAAEGDYKWSFAGAPQAQGRGRRGQAVARARRRQPATPE